MIARLESESGNVSMSALWMPFSQHVDGKALGDPINNFAKLKRSIMALQIRNSPYNLPINVTVKQ